ncbi:TPA: hypothetical protein HA235_05925 [Candidatus Woesearchaeota archaeon]|nr:hypothetical protein [Candidatus Woesearchaeota archaeon]HIH32221.1 hypothetical protein [Candidatus Woesearchaeota archaeon]HIH54721.1 hypothetical protein [Candidatus Woesearchaeota archaeon]HIJ01458.1 hypothetical protein [Candidatus Woesearchaeota archaeon]HIJ14676.1 hypothetical protein [Candidatus Woesearchaeota archaeon]
MKNYLWILSIIIVVFLATACKPAVNTAPNITIDGAIITPSNATVTNVTTTKPTTAEPDYGNASIKITGTEGDLMKINLKADDPDNDKLEYDYTKPFNDNGLWQTEDGDAGKYLVTVTVSDGKAKTSADVLVIINPSNKAPVIDCNDNVKIKEGDTVELKCNFFDKENDPLMIEYSGWMTSPTYTTNFDSSGDHKVFVRVSDGTHNVTKTIDIEVDNVNRAPLFLSKLKDLTVVESDIVTLQPNVSDPDKNELSLTFSEPFNTKGVWKTKIGDAGTYPITVVASDGDLTTKETFTLTVKMLNTAPVMKTIANVTVDEGDVVVFKPDVVDREKDTITVTYTGWMKKDTYTTTYDDAFPDGCDKAGCSATYKVTVTATDGQYPVSQDVYVTVNDKNRPPVFVTP